MRLPGRLHGPEFRLRLLPENTARLVLGESAVHQVAEAPLLETLHDCDKVATPARVAGNASFFPCGLLGAARNG